jgi:transcriptional regulator with XRE-family HTH domain
MALFDNPQQLQEMARRKAPIPIDTDWFKERLEARNLSQRRLAKEINIDPAALSLALRGFRRLQLEEAQQIAVILGVSVTEVLARAHADFDPSAGSGEKATVVGHITSHGHVHKGRTEGSRRVPLPSGLPADTLALRYQTNDHRDGWLTYYVPKKAVDREAIGRLAVVALNDGSKTMLVRMLKHGAKSGVYELVDVLGDGPPMKDVRLISASPVLWLQTVPT